MATDPELPGTDAGGGRMAVTGSLEPLFEPTSIAVYGASSRDARRLGNQLLRNVAADSSVPVVAVNPAGGAIEGVPTVPRLDRPVDLALVSVPSKRAVEAVQDATAAGAGAVIVLSSGFAEAGPEGREIQDEMLAITRSAGARLVGPNCMGVVSHRRDGAWLDGSYFWDVPRRAGGVSFLTQSGAFGGMFLAELRQRQAGLARFLSLGNAADVSVTDALAWLGADDQTEIIGVFVESVADGRRFVETARAVTRDKPVVAIKAGRSRGGARAAASHTGSIAGEYGAVRAAFLRAGVVAETDTGAFFDRLFTSRVQVDRPVRRVAIVTVSGGPGVLAADAVAAQGAELPELSAQTQAQIAPLVPDFAPTGNPVDLTPQCPPESMAPAVRAVFDAPEVDGVVLIDCGLDVPELGRAVRDAQAATGKPTTAFVLDTPQLADELVAGNIPLLPGVERAVAALVERHPAHGGQEQP